jgi:acetylornithine/N-succinyldiaminopimelate aminotransferase
MSRTEQQEAEYIINTYNRKPGLTPCLVRGEGVYVWDKEGKKYLDLLGGLAVNVIGHCHSQVVEAICKQAGTLSHVSNIYYSVPQVKLAEQLIQNTMPGGKVFFANSGTEAIEAAIKLSRRYKPGRFKIISAERSFHGRTLAALTATGQLKYREHFNPLPEGFSYATYNDLESFAALIDNQTAAILIEPVQGEGGIYVAEENFIRGLRELCDREGILLIFDEIQSGMGRTGKLWAHQNWGVRPDLMAVAKGLGGGLPIGALVAAEDYTSVFEPGDHASTFGGNPVVCSAAMAVLKIILTEGFLDDVHEKGLYLKKGLEKLISSYPDLAAEYRGLGLMCALELKKPVARQIYEKCITTGLLINAVGDTTLRLLPPLIITMDELQEGIDIIGSALKEC